MAHSAQAVTDHAEQVWAQEVAFFDENRDGILEITRGSDEGTHPRLSELAFIIDARVRDARKGKYNFESTDPSLSAALFKATWGDLNTIHDASSRRARADLRRRIAKINNTYILPMSGIQLPDTGLRTGTHSQDGSIASCLDAEVWFVNAHTQAIGGAYSEQEKLSVYHDKRGKPLVFRKSSNVSSGLTLVPIAIDGLVIPPGCIVGLDQSMKDETKLTSKKQLPSHTLLTYVVDKLALNPRRLSPWAYIEPLDRAMFSMELNYAKQEISYDARRSAIIQNLGLESFRQAAHIILATCNTI